MNHLRVVIVTQDFLRVVHDVRHFTVVLHRLQVKILPGVLVALKDFGIVELLQLAVGRRVAGIALRSALELSARVAPIGVDRNTVLGRGPVSRLARTNRSRFNRGLTTYV